MRILRPVCPRPLSSSAAPPGGAARATRQLSQKLRGPRQTQTAQREHHNCEGGRRRRIRRTAPSFTGPTCPLFTRSCLHSAASWRRPIPSRTPTSPSKSGCRSAGWNGKLQGLGNGGFAGLIDYIGTWCGDHHRDMRPLHRCRPHRLAHRCRVGHWASGEGCIDFGHRGIHEMTRVAKLVVQQFYGSVTEALLFCRMFRRRARGTDGSAALSRRLRRNTRRSARELLDRSAIPGGRRTPRPDRDSRQLHSPRQRFPTSPVQ